MLKKTLFFLLLFFIFPALCFGWQARVIDIINGNTIKVLHDGKSKIISLYGIESPKDGQPYSKEAKEFMYGLVSGQTIEIEPMLSDKKDKVIGMVYFNGKNINEKMINQGLAWVSLKTARITKIRVALRSLEAEAKETKKGLWIDPDPVAPWNF